MSDASPDERLAPVSYLPWVEPGSQDRAAPGRSTAARRPRATRLVAVDAETQAVEAGPERDERIDRLVVGRLRRSSLSINEVRAVLVEHGLDDVEVEEWIERYVRLGYLDDARLAEQVVHGHGARRGRGSVAVLAELGRRGIDEATARAALVVLDPETERSTAREVAERRMRQLSGLDRPTTERRLMAFLMRRGYAGDLVRDILSEVLPAERS